MVKRQPQYLLSNEDAAGRAVASVAVGGETRWRKAINACARRCCQLRTRSLGPENHHESGAAHKFCGQKANPGTRDPLRQPHSALARYASSYNKSYVRGKEE